MGEKEIGLSRCMGWIDKWEEKKGQIGKKKLSDCAQRLVKSKVQGGGNKRGKWARKYRAPEEKNKKKKEEKSCHRLRPWLGPTAK